MDKDYKEKLQNHIDALENAYDNIITILNEEIETEEKDGVKRIALKDDKIKIYSDGLLKSAETADTILGRIRDKKEELFKLEHPEQAKEKKEKTAEPNKSKLNKHLR